MVTKLVYFRPDKRFVKDDVLENKYACLIKDKFTTAETSITVPIYLTVFQHHTPKNSMSQRKNQSKSQFQQKLSFYLIGSNQLPPLHELTSNTRDIDRIEFQGHIGFENPVFEIISKLSGLRKITFVIYECKQGNFISDADTNSDDDKHIVCNKLVTNLNIDVKKCDDKSCSKCRPGNSSQSNHESQENSHNCSLGTSNGEDNNLEIMLIRLLQRTAKQCPNIKRLTMDVPNSNKLSKVIDTFVQDMALLKPTEISRRNNRIFVCKRGTENFQSEDNDQQNTQGIITENSDDQPDIDDVITSDNTHTEQETASKIVDEVDIENTDTININNDSLEPTPCLFDMSKLLGSMLGIPTSSLPLPPLSSSSSSTSSHSSSSSITQVPSNELIIADKQSTDTSTSEVTSSNCDFQPVNSASVEGSMNSTAITNPRTSVSVSTSSSSVEVITYAAAAASASAPSANSTATTTCNSSTANRHHHNHSKNGGNDIGSHHRHHHLHINEGSRRSFGKDGEGPGLRGDEEEAPRAKLNKSIRKPSITHVADLGKPVFISSSCKSPHKRGI